MQHVLYELMHMSVVLWAIFQCIIVVKLFVCLLLSPRAAIKVSPIP